MTTPTPITTFEDILAAMENNPQLQAAMRHHILGQEFLQLPAIVRELQRTVADLAQLVREYIAATDVRLERLEADVAGLKTDVAGLKTDVAGLKIDVAGLKTDVAGLKTDVAGLKTDVARLNGSDLERRARDNILNIAKDELGLTRGRILLARGRDTAQQLLDAIEAAEQQGLITEQQTDDVMVSDIIIRARRAADRQYVYGVFEVSRTIRANDIDRAHNRAGTLAVATKEAAIAAVIGERIHRSQQAQADRMGVLVLIPSMLIPTESDE